jgi:hypothetical protein
VAVELPKLQKPEKPTILDIVSQLGLIEKANCPQLGPLLHPSGAHPLKLEVAGMDRISKLLTGTLERFTRAIA